MKLLYTGFLSIVLVFAVAINAHGQAPQLINFQAQLDGITATTAAVTFTIYDAATGGSAQWSESYASLPIAAGRIQVLLGSSTPLDTSVFENDGDRFIEISVNGETLSPRSQLTSVAYAMRAAVADRVAGGSAAGVTSVNNIRGDVTLVGGANVSLTADGQMLTIDATGGGGTGGITTINAGAGIAVSDIDGPTTEISLAANAINDAYIADNSLTAGSLADNSVGSGELQDAILLGPNGSLEVTNGSGQSGTTIGSGAEGGTVLVKEQPGNYDAVELSTRFSGATRLGGQIFVRGQSNLASIHMFADGSTDGGRIVLREPPGDNMIVLTGEDGGRIDVFDGDNTSQAVISIDGSKQTIFTSGSIGIDIPTGQQTQADLDVRGDVQISGNLSKGSGSFKIDHPLDPLTKTLSHSFVESPDMMNVYNGNAVLDAAGEAWVELPEWFEVLNRDFRYQLTCIGGFAPVYIAEKIEGNQFKIGGGTAGLEISWQITGIRDDPYAQLHRIQVEEEKDIQNQGKYIHPDAYGVAPPKN